MGVRLSPGAPKLERKAPLSNPTEDIIKNTIEFLVKTNIIPTYKVFDITEEMLQKYVEAYGRISGKGNGKFIYSYARKLAGLNLLKLKFSRGATYKECKEGQIYLIANPAWPDHLKIGMTVNSEARLASYQTYDPFQKYYIKHYEFVLNRKEAERKLLNDFGIHGEKGEWIRFSDAKKIIKVIQNY